MRSNACVRCQGSMTRGFPVEQNANHQHQTVDWVEGTPEKSFWSGLKLKGRPRLSVETWRCGRCGFLESYAR